MLLSATKKKNLTRLFKEVRVVKVVVFLGKIHRKSLEIVRITTAIADYYVIVCLVRQGPLGGSFGFDSVKNARSD